MKNIISKINKKEFFLILLAPVSFISIFFLTRIIQNIIVEPNIIFYINRFLLFILLIFISILSMKVTTIIPKIFEDKKKSYLLGLIWIVLICSYIASFIHPTGQGIFFLEVFIPSLIINIVLTYIITLVISGLKK